MKKTDLYAWIKIGGLLSFLPFLLAAGPFGGYLLGTFLESHGAPGYLTAICIALGFIGSVREAVKIIAFTLKAAQKR